MPRRPTSGLPVSRRNFLKSASLATVGTIAPSHAFLGRRSVRVRGRVMSGREPLRGVRISDGLSVTRSGRDGRYELIADARQPYVFASIPSGHQIPVDDKASAFYYQPMQSGDSMDARFDFSALGGSDEAHSFFTLADPQTKNLTDTELFNTTTVPDMQQTIADLGDRHVFGMGCGDLMWDDLSLYPEYDKGLVATGIPFFQVIGNHDLDFGESDMAAAQTFTKRFGPTDYSFDRGAVRYVVLDDVMWHGSGYIGYLTHRQLEWLKADLADLEPGRTVVVSVHIPMLSTHFRRLGQSRPNTGTSITNREALQRILEPFNAYLIAGHTHESDHVIDGGVQQVVSGAVCGGWWTGPICIDGTPNGYGVFDVEGESVSWRYKSTGKSADHQMRVYPAGSEPTAPNEIVANVWDATPVWKVFWYENGERKGMMSQRVGYDPLAVELLDGPELPAGDRGWVNPKLNNHMFYAPATPGAEIRVEAVTPAGVTYSEIVKGS